MGRQHFSLSAGVYIASLNLTPVIMALRTYRSRQVRYIFSVINCEFSTTPLRRDVTRGNKTPALSFRSMLSAMREQGDIVDITEPVSPHLELAAITRRV